MNAYEQGLARLAKKYNSFKYNIVNGQPVISIGSKAFTGSDAPKEALAYMHSLNLTNIHTFMPGQPAHLRPGSGPGFFPNLEALAEELDLRIDRFSMQRQYGDEQFNAIQRIFGQGDTATGFVFAKNDMITGLKFYGKDGSELARDEILNLLESKGYNLKPDGKLLKRLRAVTNEYQFGATGLKGKSSIKALIFDPTRTSAGADMMGEYGYELIDGQYRIKSGRAIGTAADDFAQFTDRQSFGVMSQYTKSSARLNTKLQEDIVKAWNALSGKTPKRFVDLTEEEIVEAGRYIESMRGVKRTMDGQVFGSRKLSDVTGSFLRDRAQSIEDSLSANLVDVPDPNLPNAIVRDSPDHVRLMLEVKKLRKNAEEMDRISINGGRFNFRAMGFDAEVIGDFEEYATDKVDSIQKGYIGQIKGDIEIIGDKSKKLGNWTKIVSEYLRGNETEFTVNQFGELVHIKTGKVINLAETSILAPFDSLTTEFSTKRGADSAKRGTAISFATHGEGRKVFVDAQALLADPELFSSEAIRIKTMHYVTSQMEELKTNKIVSEYSEYLADEAAGLKPRASGLLSGLIEEADNGSREAAELLDLLKAGIGPMENQTFVGYFTTALKELSTKKSGMPRVLMPAAQQAQIGSTISADLTGLADGGVKEGYISFVKGKGFLLNRFDYNKYYDAFGGFDLDDMLRSHLRWDRGSDSLISVTKRTPGALGEIGVFKVDMQDDLVSEMLEEMSTKKDYVLSHLESEKLLTAKIKVKANLMMEQARQTGGSNGLTLSKNIQAIIDSGEVTAEESRLLIGKPAGEALSALDLLNAYVPTEDIDVLDQQLLALRSGRKDLVKKVMEEEKLGLDEEAVKKLRGTSVALSDEAIPAYARYKSVSEKVKQLHQQTSNQLLNTLGLGGVDIDDTRTVGNVLDDSVAALKESEGVLGEYSNMRMVIDNLINTTREKASQATIDNLNGLDGIITLFQQEDVIDSIVQEGGRNASVIRSVIDEDLEAMAQVLHQGGVMDKAIMENEFGEFKLNSEWAQRLSTRLTELNPDRAFEDYFVEGQLSEFMRQSRITLDMANEEIRRALKDAGATKEIRDELFTLAERKQAQELMATFRSAYQLAEEEIPDLDSIIDQANTFGEGVEYGPQEIANFKAAKARGEVLRTIQERYSGTSGELTDEGRRVMGAFIRQHGLGTIEETIGEGGERIKSSLMMGDEFGGMYRTTSAWFKGLAFRAGRLRGAAEGQGEEAERIGSQVIDLAGIGESDKVILATGDRSDKLVERIAGELDVESFGGERFIRNRAARELSGDVADATGGLVNGGVTGGTIEGIKTMFGRKTFRYGAAAVGGAVAFSALYQKFKDRSPEDLQGPPLLPGGSFYENKQGQYKQNIINSSQSGQNGVTYRVRATGKFDVNELSSSMQGVTGANVNSTSYQSRGYQRTDPVSEAINGYFK